MPDVPKSFSDLLERWPEVQADMEFVRQLRQLKILTNRGDVMIQSAPGAENAVLDLKAVLALILAPFQLPDQTGNSGKYLTTDGANPSWGTVAAGGGATKYTKIVDYDGQTIAAATATALTFDAGDIVVNADSIWSAGAPTRLTLTAGLWILKGNIGWGPNNNTGYRKIYWSANGSSSDFPTDGVLDPPTNSTSGNAQETSCFYRADAGDYLELIAYHINTPGDPEDAEFSGISCVRIGD